MKVIDRKDMQDLSAWVVDTIQRRTRRGISAEGTRFLPRKDKLPHPILIKTGAMLSGVKATVTDTTFEVSDTEPYARFVQVKRPFMGLTKQEADALRDRLVEAMRARVRQGIK